MRMGRLQTAIVSVLGVALLAAIGVAVHQYRRLEEVQQKLKTTSQSLQVTKDSLRQTQLRLAAALRRPPKPTIDYKALLAQRDATIKQLKSELSSAQASVTQLQQELASTQAQDAKKLASAGKHADDLQADLRSQISALQKNLASAQTHIQKSEQRIAELQKANAKLGTETNTSTRRIAEREHILNNLQRIDQRRQSYLTSITERCRNITSQFRTMSGMLGANRGQDSRAFSGAALDLIQNALITNDNDLQQLSQLNSQAYRLEKKLTKM